MADEIKDEGGGGILDEGGGAILAEGEYMTGTFDANLYESGTVQRFVHNGRTLGGNV